MAALNANDARVVAANSYAVQPAALGSLIAIPIAVQQQTSFLLPTTAASRSFQLNFTVTDGLGARIMEQLHVEVRLSGT